MRQGRLYVCAGNEGMVGEKRKGACRCKLQMQRLGLALGIGQLEQFCTMAGLNITGP